MTNEISRLLTEKLGKTLLIVYVSIHALGALFEILMAM
jgi:hypothetical protein